MTLLTKNPAMTNTCIIVTGPTASGKTTLAIKLAQYFNTEIISADSRQCFKELNIGVAKPSESQLNEVVHHFISTHSIKEEVNAAIFEKYALQSINGIFNSTPVALMAGGTGLYIKAFCEGMDDLPSIDPSIRQQIVLAYSQNGINWLQQQVEMEDPLYYASGEILNPHRLMRALEVVRGTGKSIISFQRKEKKSRDFKIIKLGIELPRQELYNNINQRVDEMIEDGLIEEARDLLPYQKYNALQTVGYREIFDYFNNEISKEQAVDAIKQNTRHYAKRQLTWFKKDETIHWFAPDKIDSIIEYINV